MRDPAGGSPDHPCPHRHTRRSGKRVALILILANWCGSPLTENAGYSDHGGGSPPTIHIFSTQTVAEFYRRRSKANIWTRVVADSVLERGGSRSNGSAGRKMANTSPASLVSPVGTAWPATRPAHSFLKFRAYPLNVLPSGFRFLDRDNPAYPLIAREWRNILPLCQRRRVGNERCS